jgi:hypothetical protein
MFRRFFQDGSPATESINDTLKARGSVRDPREYALNEIANFSGEEGETH